MVKSYWKHPLLVNPSKWVTIERAHAPQLYQRGYYDTDALANNPIALGLSHLIDNTTATATANTLIPLVVQPDRDSPQRSYHLLPAVKPISQQIADRDDESGSVGYVPNNRQVISSSQRRQVHRLYLPEEIRFTTSNPARVASMSPRFPDMISQDLQQAIQRMLQEASSQEVSQEIQSQEGQIQSQGQVHESEEVQDSKSQIQSQGQVQESDGQGLALSNEQFVDSHGTPRATGIYYRGATPVVCVGNLITLPEQKGAAHQEVYLPFRGNTDLCQYIFTFADYNKTTPLAIEQKIQ